MILTKDPKLNNWKSLKYRRWIRKNQSCKFCAKDFLDHKESFQGHHHRHSGGKTPSDHLIIPMCDFCHSSFHFNEATFNDENLMNDVRWLNRIRWCLAQYVESLNINALWVQINALAEVAKENE